MMLKRIPPTRAYALLGAATLAMIALPPTALPAQAATTSYYVDCSASTNGAGTQASPWNSVAPVNSTTFGAGDQVHFKDGTTCYGQVTPHGSGAAGNPITMTSYGTGAKPIIDAAGAAGAVIRLLNVQQWEVSGLELRNAAASPDYRSGIVAENSTGTTLRHIVVTNMTIRNISGWPGGWYSSNAGVGIQTDHTTPISTWDDIQITDNSFDHVDRIAVAVTPDADGQGTGLTTGVQILRNTMRYSGGDDILVVKGQGAVMDHNDAAYGGSKSMTGCPPSGQYCNGASASIWVAGSNDSLIQSNSVACDINQQDGMAFDVDWGNHNTTIQYNYSRNNSGGFLMLMPPISGWSDEPTSALPSDGTVVRYNVSEDETNTAVCPIQSNFNRAHLVIDIPGVVPNRSNSAAPWPDFYNNTIYIPAGRSTAVVGTRSGNFQPGYYQFRNNLVLNYGSGGYLQTTGGTFANNLLYGPHNTNEPTAGTIRLAPQLAGPLASGTQASAGAGAYRPTAGSPALANGAVISGNGGQDFIGTALGPVPSIGAFETPASSLVANGGFDSGLAPWTLSGGGSSVVTSQRVNGTAALQTGAVNSGVENRLTGLTPSTTYILTAWMKVARAGEQVALGAKAFGGTETFSKSTTTDWGLNTVIFTTGSTSTSATIYCYKNAGAGAGYCDNVSLTMLIDPSNHVANAGFESGSLFPWGQSGAGAFVGTAAANSGTYGLVTGASNSGAGQVVSGLRPGKTYALSGWLNGGSNEQIALGVKNYGGAESYQQVLGSQYGPATVVFTTSTSATSATVYCYKNTGVLAGACDDIRVTALD